MKKPFFKRWWFWVAAVVVVLGAIGNMGGEEPSGGSVNRELADNAQVDATGEEGIPADSDEVKPKIAGKPLIL